MSDTLPQAAPQGAVVPLEARNVFARLAKGRTSWALTLAFRSSQHNWHSPAGTPPHCLPKASLQTRAGWVPLLPWRRLTFSRSRALLLPGPGEKRFGEIFSQGSFPSA